MWTLTGFADEISPDLEQQLGTLRGEGIRWLELRSVWGKNVLRLSDAELATLKGHLEHDGVQVSCIASPVGKISITAPFDEHLVEFQRALEVAHILSAPYVRVFSFYIPDGDSPGAHRTEVLTRMAVLARLAEESNIIILHENEKHIYGDIPSRCLDLLENTQSPALRAAWDPANFVQCGVRPFSEGYKSLRPYVDYIHVKDALLETGMVVPAGEGDGEWPTTIDALQSSGFKGYFSLEPHLAESGSFSGFSGPRLWSTASQRFKELLRERSVSWE